MNLARRIVPLMCAGTLICCIAFAQDSADRFYQAIRNDNLGSLRSMAVGTAVNSADRHGTTPLMDAAAFGSTGAVHLLLDRGADPNVKNAFGATALMWAAGDMEKSAASGGEGCRCECTFEHRAHSSFDCGAVRRLLRNRETADRKRCRCHGA
jgi:hypothetical protein